MKYWLYPESAEDHTKQVAYYEQMQPGLDRRYHTEFQNLIAWVCATPDRSRIILAPDIRRAMFKFFHFDLIYRALNGQVQVLAIAHHCRQPGYWSARL